MNDDEEELRVTPYIALRNRFLALEASHAKLKEQFEVLLREKEAEESRRGQIPGFLLSGSTYGSVLQSMGHAVHIARISSGEIIYWNRSAELLYGWKDYEALGQRVADLLISEENFESIEKIMEWFSSGQSWSGQFPFKKRSGEIFMVIVSQSPLYEDGELVGVITVSSDAAIFNHINSENPTTYQGRAHGQPRYRGLNMKNIQCFPQPWIPSSTSNLEKVLVHQHEDDTCSACESTKNKGEPVLDSEDIETVKTETPEVKPSFRLHFGKITERKSFIKDTPVFEFGQPSKIAAKVLAKLHIGRSVNDAKDDCPRDPPLHGPSDISAMCTLSSRRCSSEAAMNHYSVDSEKKEARSDERNSVYAVKSVYPKGNALNTRNTFEDDCSAKNRIMTSWLECRECFGVPTAGILLPPRLGIEQDGKEAWPNEEKLEILEADATVPQQPEIIQSPTQFNSGGSIGNSNVSSPTKGDKESNLLVDCEIHWEDLLLGEEIGKGASAVVYRGIWRGSDVAIKVYSGSEYHEGMLLDYKKEIDIMKRLRHPNVLLFMGALYSPELLAIVTEFLPRGSLFKTLHKSNQVLDIKRRLRMALDIARGMNYLHHRNPPIVHRDLKSSNLLVDKNWTVKVGDFGLSKLKIATFLTAKSGRGTPQWMAPEVLRNEPSNEKSDLFSFGVILWELMTESIPWINLNPLQVVGIVGFMDCRLDLPEGLDPRVSSIIQDCWQSDPDSRPSFKDIIQRMMDLIQTVDVTPVCKS